MKKLLAIGAVVVALAVIAGAYMLFIRKPGTTSATSGRIVIPARINISPRLNEPIRIPPRIPPRIQPNIQINTSIPVNANVKGKVAGTVATNKKR